MTPERASRVADFIRAELADVLARRMRDPRVSMVTVNDVRVSRDLAFADVYVSSLTAQDAASRTRLVEVLDHASGFLRTALARRSDLRTTPRLRFHYDDLAETGARLEALIDRAVSADAGRRHGA